MLRFLIRRLAPAETHEQREGQKIRVITSDGRRTSSTTMRIFEKDDVVEKDASKADGTFAVAKAPA